MAWATPGKFGTIWSTFALVFGPFSPRDRAMICLVSGPSPPGLMSGDITPCPLYIWACFPCYSNMSSCKW
jgi:hypothetical protein